MKKILNIIISLLLIITVLIGCSDTNPSDENRTDNGNSNFLPSDTVFDSSHMSGEQGSSNNFVVPLRLERKVSDQSLEDASKGKYVYAIININSMTKGDLTAVGNYLAKIVEANVLVADSSKFSTAAELYMELSKDHQMRGGEIVGIQIFGNSDMVPSFEINYRVQMRDSVHEEGAFLTDLFYGNLDNDPEKINTEYSVLDHFANNWDVDLVPQWKVARLPLSRGQFTGFFRKYENFITATQLSNPDIVSFSSPIFASPRHIDDVGAFLERADKELGVLRIPYRLYANLDGDYPVQNPNVLGNMIPDNITYENNRGIAEFIINGHGDADYIIRTAYKDGKTYSEYVIDKQYVNQILNKNAYYMDTWSCYVGRGMRNNLTTTALAGKCVGMFSATTIISNNGTDRAESISDMKGSNFFYFYYIYLKTLPKVRPEAMLFLRHSRHTVVRLLKIVKRQYGGIEIINLTCIICWHIIILEF